MLSLGLEQESEESKESGCSGASGDYWTIANGMLLLSVIPQTVAQAL
jgi:hypothetical protein